MAFETEVDDILRELLREPGTLEVQVVTEGVIADAATGGLTRCSLGGGAELIVSVGVGAPPDLPTTIERAARDLRACARRHGMDRVPSQSLAGKTPRSRAALLVKVRDFLGALAAMHGATGALVLRSAEVIAQVGSIEPAHAERLPFLRKRIDAEAARTRGRSSHAEVVGDDVFARSFWFDAYLVIFFNQTGWALDFVRYRARAVCRALSVILPHLESEPPTPANVRPLPPRRW